MLVIVQVLLLVLLVVCWQILRLLSLIVESWNLDGAPRRKKKIKELDKVLDKLHEEHITLLVSGRPTDVIDQREKELNEKLDELFESQELYAPCGNGVLIRVLDNLIEIKKLLETPRASG